MNSNLPNGEMDITESGKSITKNTAKNTSENKQRATTDMPPDVAPANSAGRSDKRDVVVSEKEPKPIVSKMIQFGVHEPVARKLADEYTTERIEAGLHYCAVKGYKAGALVTYLADDWPDSSSGGNPKNHDRRRYVEGEFGHLIEH